MELENVLHLFTRKQEDRRKFTISQNGIKFRTICQKCNNKLLGKKYDPIINEFTISVGKYLQSTLILPKIIFHKTKPIALIKGILGHLLAARIPTYDGSFDVIARETILDEKKKIPNDIHVFYWIYPYAQVGIMRDFLMPSKRGDFSNFGFFQVLKYFPIGYLITDLPQYEKLDELTKFRQLSIHDEVEIPIRLNRIEDPFWPEIVDRGNFLFIGQSLESAMTAIPRRKK